MRKQTTSRWTGLLDTFGFGRGKKAKGIRATKRRTFSIEPLEERQLLSVATWTGSGDGSNWNNASNWVRDGLQAVPQTNDDLLFTGTGVATNNNLTPGITFRSIEFASTGFSISGNSFTLASSSCITLDTGSTTISANIALGGTLLIDALSDSSLTISGAISNSGTATGSLMMGFDSVDNITLTLSGQNTFTGATRIYTGVTVLCCHDNCLSTSASIILCGGTLDLGGYSQTTSGNLSFSTNSGGILQNGSLTLTGTNTRTVTVSKSGTINANLNLWRSADYEVLNVSEGQTVTIGGIVDFTDRELYISDVGRVVFNGSSFTGDTLRIYNDGGTTFNSGNLTTSSGIYLGWYDSENEIAWPGTIAWNSSGTLTPGGILAIGYNGSDGVITQTAGTVDLTASGCTTTISSSGSTRTNTVYNLNGGVLKARSIMGYTSNSLLSLGGGTFQPTNDYTTPSGSLLSYVLATETTSTISTGSNNLTLPIAISGNGALTKSGSGTLTLTGANTYTGTTTVAAGTLALGGASVLYSGSTKGNVVVEDNAILDLGNYGLTIKGLGGEGNVTSTGSNAVLLTLNGNNQSVAFSGTIDDGVNSTIAVAKTGSSTQTFSGDNDYSGGTIISAGTLVAANPDSLPGYDVDNEISVAANATLGITATNWQATEIGDLLTYVSFTTGSNLGLDVASGSFEYSNSIIGDVGLVKLGEGTLILSGTDNDYTSTTIREGTLRLDDDDILPADGNITVSGGTLDLDGNSQHTTGSVVFQGGTVQNGTLVKSGGYFDAKSGTITATLAGTASLRKTTTDTLTLNGTNTYTGGTTILGGTLATSNADALPGYGTAGKLSLASWATLSIAAGGTGEWTADDVDDLLANASFAAGNLAFDVSLGDTFSYSTPISSSRGVIKLGEGALTLSGNSSYIGGTSIKAGTLALGNNNALGNASNGLLVTGGAELDLNGHDISTGAVTLENGTITGDAGDTLTANSYATLTGAIGVNLGANAATLTKSGSGTVTLTGDNDYTGLTTVYGGTLTLYGSDAWTPVLTGGGSNIQDGRIVFDYTGGTTPASTVENLLMTSFHTGLWDTGKFLCTTHDDSHTLGWYDYTASHQLAVARAMLGDTNVDGKVDGGDMNVILSNYDTYNNKWNGGNFWYTSNGYVGGGQLNVILSNYNQTLSGLAPSVVQISRLGSGTTNANSVQFVVVFSEAVSGVDIGDFSVALSDTNTINDAAISISSVQSYASGAVYLVTVEGVYGTGTLGLNLKNDGTIVDSSSLALTTTGFTTVNSELVFVGQTYTAASPYIWDGGSTANDNWTTVENWVGDAAPSAGDSILFTDSGTTPISAVNDFTAGTSFRSITIAADSFILSGHDLALTTSIIVGPGATGVISLDVTMVASITVDTATDATLAISGDLGGTATVTKTGLGSLWITGNIGSRDADDFDVQEGELRTGTLDSVFVDGLPTIYSGRTQLARIANLNNNQGLSLANLGSDNYVHLNDGKVLASLGSIYPGVLATTAAVDCDPGEYPITAVYTYSGGFQKKTFSLNVEREDLPPVTNILVGFTSWVDPVPVVQEDTTEYCVDFSKKCVDREGGLHYSVLSSDLPTGSELSINSESGILEATFGWDDRYHIYTYDVMVTDSSGNVNILYGVVAVSPESYCDKWYSTCVAQELVGSAYLDLSGNLLNYLNPFFPTYDVNSWLDQSNTSITCTNPKHGSLSLDTTHAVVVYTPDDGFRGLDSFDCHWTYTLFDYSTGKPTQQIHTNICHEMLQVGPWIGISTGDSSATGGGSQAIGTTTEVTLELNNIRDDGVITAERWYLDFDPNVIRVYDEDGYEILPGGPTGSNQPANYGVEFVEDITQLHLTVVTVGPGTTALTASSDIWSADDNSTLGKYYPAWTPSSASSLNFAVDGCKASSGCGCAVDTPNGDLLHGNTTSKPSGEAASGLVLPTYNSQENSQPILSINYTIAKGLAVPDYLEVYVTGGMSSSAVYYGMTNGTTTYQAGDTIMLSVQAGDMTSSVTGHYSYTFVVREHRGSNTRTVNYAGTYDYVNRTQSEFGKYWWLDGLDQLVVNSIGSGSALMYVEGDGTATWLSPDSTGVYWFNGNKLTYDAGIYTLTFSDGGSEVFGFANYDFSAKRHVFRTTSRTDAAGNETVYAYFTEGKIDSITDSLGQITTFTYDNGHVSTITTTKNGTSRVTTLAHDGSLLTSITLPNSGTGSSAEWSYDYSSTGLLTAVTNPNNASVTYDYDRYGRFQKETYPNTASRTLIPFDVKGLPTAEDVLNDHDGSSSTKLAPLTRASDAVAVRIDQYGEETTYKIDRYGLAVSETDSLGNATLYQRDGNGRVTQMTEPDPDGTGPLGTVVTKYEYDSNGNCTKAIYNAGTDDETFETWTYGAKAAVTRHVDVLGRITTYQIDRSTGLTLSMTQVVGTEGGTDDITTSYVYTNGAKDTSGNDYANSSYVNLPKGLLLTETDPLGHVTSYAYGTTSGQGSFGRVTSITYALGTADQSTVQYEYDARGNRTAVIDALGRRTEYVYNSLDELVSTTEPDPDGNGSLTTSTTTYQYDGLGNVTHTVDSQGNDTQTQYCPLGIRTTKTTGPDPDGSGSLTSPTTIYGYDEGLRLVSVTDPLSQVTRYKYDVLGRQTETYTGAILDNGAVSYAEPTGTWSSLTSGYNSTSRTAATATSTTATATWSFDNLSAGQYDIYAIWTADAQNANDAPFTVNYDAQSATVDVNQSVAPAGNDSILVGNVRWYKIGTYTITGDSITVELGNNAQADKRVVADAVYVQHYQYTTQTEYYANGSVSKKTTAADASTEYVTEYRYDAQGQVTDVLSPGNVVTHYDYNAAGELLWTKTYASGDFTLADGELRAQSQYLYDDLGRVRETRVYEVDPTTGAVGDYLATKTWYDKAGNVVKTQTGEGAFQKYAYDAQGRVVATFVCYDADETGDDQAAALTVLGDTVVQQTRTWYDAAGQVVATAAYERFAGDTTTEGELSAANSYTTASVAWYDGRGRATATADFGREDVLANASWTRYFFHATVGTDASGSYIAGSLIDVDRNGIPDIAESARELSGIETLVEDTSSQAGIDFQLSVTQYNDAGLPYRTLDNLGRITETQYDRVGHVVKTIQNYDNGTVEATDTARDVTVEYQYDSAGRLVTMIAYNAKGSGNVEQQTTSYLYQASLGAWQQTAVVYPDSGDTLQQNATTHLWTITTDAGDHVSTTYDALGRTATTTDQRGVVHTYVYDSAGRLWKDLATAPGGWGDVDHTTDFIVTTYDDIGRVRSVTSYDDQTEWAASATASSQWSSRPATNAAGEPDVTTYGDVAGSWMPRPAVHGDLETLTLTYATPLYANGVTIRENNDNGFVRKIEVRNASTGMWETVWQDADPTQQNSVLNFNISFDERLYLVDGVRVTVFTGSPNSYPAIDAVQLHGSTVVNQVEYVYDSWGNLYREYQAHDGKVDANGDGTPDTGIPYTQYNYDDGAGTGDVAAYVRLTDVVYPNGRSVGYNYAAGVDSIMSRLSFISDSTGTLSSYKYLGLGTIVEEDDTGAKLSYLDSSGNVTGLDRFGRVVDQVWTDYADNPIDRYTYEYDLAGNRTSKLNELNHDLDETYEYDALNRLTEWDVWDVQQQDWSVAKTWTLDSLGNNLSAGSYDEANQETPTGMSGDLYDAAGNMTTLSTGNTARYDAWNRMTAAELSGSAIEKMEYDGTNRRIQTFSNFSGTGTSATASVVDDYYLGQQVIESHKTTAYNLTTKIGTAAGSYQNIWSPRYIDAPILRDALNTAGTAIVEAERILYLGDANFNVTGVLKKVENVWTVVERYTYTPYGIVTVRDADWTALSVNKSQTGVDNTLLYTGKSLSWLTLLQYNIGRYYDGLLERFINRDPIRYGGDDANLYRYVGDNPIIFVDPSGLKIAACCRPAASQKRCIYIFTWMPHGNLVFGDTMQYGHSGISLSANADPVYGFHGTGIMVDLDRDAQGNITGVMKNETLKSVYRCCCLTKSEYNTFKNEIARLQAKIIKKEKTDLHDREYSGIDSRGLFGKKMTNKSYPVCSGMVAYEARLGEANISPNAGNDPMILEAALAKNKYCEEVGSSYMIPGKILDTPIPPDNLA